MQNIEQILKEYGIELPADKAKEINSKIAENYIAKNEFDKKIQRVESERDSWKDKAETAEETLKGFDGVDLETMKTELSNWKNKAETAEREASEKLYARDFSDALKAELEHVKFTSEFAKAAVMREIEGAGLKLKDGKILGLSDLLAQMKEKDASAFVDEEEESANQNAARFTKPNAQKSVGKMTKEEIMAIKDPVDRQKKIAENMDLFGKV